MKTYVGTRLAPLRCSVVVVEDGDGDRLKRSLKPLPVRLDLANHSPDGFEWGYGGSGPAQLALAILADHLGDDPLALELHQPFKWRCIARVPRDMSWSLTAPVVDEVLHSLRTRAQMKTALETAFP